MPDIRPGKNELIAVVWVFKNAHCADKTVFCLRGDLHFNDRYFTINWFYSSLNPVHADRILKSFSNLPEYNFTYCLRYINCKFALVPRVSTTDIFQSVYNYFMISHTFWHLYYNLIFLSLKYTLNFENSHSK